MANEKVVPIFFEVNCDGVSASYSLDLISDPYIIVTPTQGLPKNWFVDEKRGAPPVGVVSNVPTAFSATLSGTVVTITWRLTPIPSGIQGFQVNVLF